MKDSANLADHLAALLAEAKKAGASAADATAAQSTHTSGSMREGKLNDLERSEAMEISLRVLVGQRQASLATAMLSAKDLKSWRNAPSPSRALPGRSLHRPARKKRMRLRPARARSVRRQRAAC